MPLQVYNPDLDQARTPLVGYSFTDMQPGRMWRRSGVGRPQGKSFQPFSTRVYTWPTGMTEAQRLSLFAFFEAMGWQVSVFCIRDPRDQQRRVVVGQGDGAETTFSLPVADTDPEYRYHLVAGHVAVAVDGPGNFDVAAITVDDDGHELRGVTLDNPPDLNDDVELIYWPARLVMLANAAGVQINSVDPDYGTAGMQLVEVVRNK